MASAVRTYINIAEFIAVIATLGILIWQVQKNTSAIEDATLQAIMSENISVLKLMVTNEELVTAQLKYQENPDSLTESESARKFFLDRLWWRQWENVYFQHENGKLKDEPWNGFKNMICTQPKRPIDIQHWEGHTPHLSKMFIKFVEECNGYNKKT